MRDWRVLIVEDDAMVASIHRRVVAAHPRFNVVAVASSAEQALGIARRGVAFDLVLLDLALPGADGAKLLRVLRNEQRPEVIVVTASRDRQVVQTLLHLGVMDYLVKPFTIERLQEALVRFKARMRAYAGDRLDQEEIDSLCAPDERRMLPKGLRPSTLQTIRNVLAESDDMLTAKEVADRTAVARVTARRYLEYLVTVRQADSQSEGDGPGRPPKRYRSVRLDSSSRRSPVPA
jgi:two-component system, CitB family, response regulator DctR